MASMLWVPDRRDIIWIDCSPQVGQEMKDLHPMLVLSPQVFNDRTSLVIGLPMTTSASNDDNPFAVKILGPRAVVSYILGHQPKSFDWRRRGAKPHPWKQAPLEVFAAACEQLNQIIAICE
ncbi:MAG: type II toxin-antitoxin system PemK/MazF family toxin [Burkholderiales bacterium]